MATPECARVVCIAECHKKQKAGYGQQTSPVYLNYLYVCVIYVGEFLVARQQNLVVG